MRILNLSDLYPPVIGGLERNVQTVSRELVRRGHEVAVATLARDGGPALRDDEGVRVHAIQGWSRALGRFYQNPAMQLLPPAPDPGIVAALRGLLARERPDVVHARSWMAYSYLPLAARASAKLVVSLHDYFLVCPKRSFLHGGATCAGAAVRKCVACASEEYGALKATAMTAGLRASARLNDRVDRYVAVSSAVRDACLPAIRRPAEEVTIVPSLVPDGVLEAVDGTRPAFLPESDGYLLFVGAIGRHKGIEVLLDAYAGLREPPPLVILGASRGAEQVRLPPGVVVARDVPHADVMRAWARASVAVIPSLWPEPFGQVAVEAMATGRPVVASATGGLSDVVVDGETGLLVPPGDATALRGALAALLADPERRRRMGEAGRRRAPRFMASAVTDQLEAVYREVVAAA